MIRKVLALILAFLMIPVCALGETVVTSFYPIWLLALNLADGIDSLEVRNLAAPDTGCLHDYQLQTTDMKVLSGADLFLVNGAGMESYLNMVFSSFPDLQVAEASKGIPLLTGVEALSIGNVEDGEEEQANAHVWLSAANAAKMAENMAEAMATKFPEKEGLIRENCGKLVARLESLDQELKEGLSSLSSREIVTFHEAFPYFAEAYNLQVVAVVNREPGETLTPAQLAHLTEVIKDLGNPPLFVEPQYEDLSARALAAETGAPVYTLDPVVTGPESNVPLDYYETVMRQNMETLRMALGVI